MSDTDEKLIFRPASWFAEDTNARIARAYEAANEKREHKYPTLAGALMAELEVACREIDRLRSLNPAPPKTGGLASCPFCEEEGVEVTYDGREFAVFCPCCETRACPCRKETQTREAWNSWATSRLAPWRETSK